MIIFNKTITVILARQDFQKGHGGWPLPPIVMELGRVDRVYHKGEDLDNSLYLINFSTGRFEFYGERPCDIYLDVNPSGFWVKFRKIFDWVGVFFKLFSSLLKPS